jgi:hypothetical protein
MALIIFDLKEKQKIPYSYDIESKYIKYREFNIWEFGKNKLLLVSSVYSSDTKVFIIDVQSKALRATTFGI